VLSDKATARVLAGTFSNRVGPFATRADVLILDFELSQGGEVPRFDIPDGHDCALVYMYEGECTCVGQVSKPGEVFVLNAAGASGDSAQGSGAQGSARGFTLQAAGGSGCSALLFTGKALKEPIAWGGSIVMNTQEQLEETYKELRSGSFPPVRVPWDYKRAAARPSEEL
jgi:redox-sensitive bicupin YhaK (pirin superfamily)